MVVLPVERVLELDSCDAFAVSAPDLAAIFYSDRLTGAEREMLRSHLGRAVACPGRTVGVMVPRGAAAAMEDVKPSFEDCAIALPPSLRQMMT